MPARSKLIHRRSGLLGVSGSSDAHPAPVDRRGGPRGDRSLRLPDRARRSARWPRRWAASLVFTGGIGENDAQTRSEVGGPVSLARPRARRRSHRSKTGVISTKAAGCPRVIPTDERMIASIRCRCSRQGAKRHGRRDRDQRAQVANRASLRIGITTVSPPTGGSDYRSSAW